jgi:3-dehydroquinate synthetase
LALTNGNYLCDINEIWEAIPEGRIQTLFLEENLFQSAQITKNALILVGEEDRNLQNVVDDIYDELIEANLNHGGDVVFLPDGSLKKFNGFAAITRY